MENRSLIFPHKHNCGQNTKTSKENPLGLNFPKGFQKGGTLSLQLMFVSAYDVAEIESIVNPDYDPYYDLAFDSWDAAGDNRIITDWDLPNTGSKNEFRTAEWFLGARERVNNSWLVWIKMAEKVIGRQVSLNGFDVTKEEYIALREATERMCINSRGYLLEQGMNLFGALGNKAWVQGGYLINKPTLFQGCGFMEAGDCWSDPLDTEDEGFERIKNLPADAKIWLIDLHG
ncbi:MAG: hypothetical protein ACYDH2_12260 [Anaerolineaceae bacterium]